MKKGATSYVMLGRVVMHSSPASLSRYGPRTIQVREEEPIPAAFADMPSATIGRTKGLSKEAIQGYAKIGAAIGAYFRDKPFDPQGQTQTAGYTAYRAGERASY